MVTVGWLVGRRGGLCRKSLPNKRKYCNHTTTKNQKVWGLYLRFFPGRASCSVEGGGVWDLFLRLCELLVYGQLSVVFSRASVQSEFFFFILGRIGDLVWHLREGSGASSTAATYATTAGFLSIYPK